jgi:hypothetical protein
MKTMILAAAAAISLTAAIAPAAHAFIAGSPHPAHHTGPYDNTQASQRSQNISSSDAPGG